MNREPICCLFICLVRMLLCVLSVHVFSSSTIRAQDEEFTTYEVWKWMLPEISSSTGPRMSVRSDRNVTQTGPVSAVLSSGVNQIVLADGQAPGGFGTGYDYDFDGYSNQQEWDYEALEKYTGGLYAAHYAFQPLDDSIEPIYDYNNGDEKNLLYSLYGPGVDIDRDGFSDDVEHAWEAAVLAAPDSYAGSAGRTPPETYRNVAWSMLADGSKFPVVVTGATPARNVKAFSGSNVRLIGVPADSKLLRPQGLYDYSAQYYFADQLGKINVVDLSVYQWGRKYNTAALAATMETDVTPGIYTVEYRSSFNASATSYASVQLYSLPNDALTIGPKRPTWLLRTLKTQERLDRAAVEQSWVNGRLQFDPDLPAELTWDHLAQLGLANANSDSLKLKIVDENGLRIWPDPIDYPVTDSIDLSLFNPNLRIQFGKLYGIPGVLGGPTSILSKNATMVFSYGRKWKTSVTGDWSTVTLNVPVRMVQSYQSWRNFMFSGLNVSDDSVSGPYADYDQDGLTNLQEYNSGTDPLKKEYSFFLEMGNPQNLNSMSVTLSAKVYNSTKIEPITLTEWGFVYSKKSDNPKPTIGGAFSYSVPKSSSLTTATVTKVSTNPVAYTDNTDLNAVIYTNSSNEVIRPPYPASLISSYDLNITSDKTTVKTDNQAIERFADGTPDLDANNQPVWITERNFDSPIEANTTYVCRAYAFTASGSIEYSDEYEFTTPAAKLPTVYDPYAKVEYRIDESSLTNTSILSLNAGATTIDNGGDPIIEQGIVYSCIDYNDLPTLGGNYTISKIAKLVKYNNKDEIIKPYVPSKDLEAHRYAILAVDGKVNASATNAAKELVPGKTYAYRAYVKNSVGVAYSEYTGRFTVPKLAVTTTPPTLVGTTYATVGGEVTNDGAYTLVERGIVYSTSSTRPTLPPPTSDDKQGTIRSSQNLLGSYSVFINNLSPGKTYYYWSYVKNANNATEYGSPSQFTTLSTVPILNSTPTVDVTSNSATWKYLNVVEGGSSLLRYGFVYQIYDRTAGSQPLPTYTNGGSSQVVKDGTETTFTLSTDAASPLEPGKEYRVRAFAINSIGIGYSEAVLFVTSTKPILESTYSNLKGSSVDLIGAVRFPYVSGVDGTTGKAILYADIERKKRLGTIKEVGFVYALDSSGSNLEPGDGSTTITLPIPTSVEQFSASVSDLSGGSKYRFRAYATMTFTDLSEQTGYSDVLTFDTLELPQLGKIEVDATTITAESANVTAEYNTTNGQYVDSGFVYCLSSVSASPVIGGSNVTKISVPVSLGKISTVLTGLTQKSEYSVRAYAQNENGVVYSSVPASFITLKTPEVSLPTVDSISSYRDPGGSILFKAILGGKVDPAGNVGPFRNGVLVSNILDSVNPTLTTANVLKFESTSTTTGVFTVPVDQLDSNTTYVFRAYSTTSAGTGYSAVAWFRTPGLPVVGSPFISDIVNTSEVSSVLLGVTLISNGGESVSKVGIVYSITNENSIPTLGGAFSTEVVAATLPVVSKNYDVRLSLSRNTTYSVRSYAYNGDPGEVSYSPVWTFSTDNSIVYPTVASFYTGGSYDTTNLWATMSVGGSVISNGGSDVTERGFVYSAATDNPDPIIGGTKVTKYAVTGTADLYNHDITELKAATTYVFRAYAINSIGVGYSPPLRFTTANSTAAAAAASVASVSELSSGVASVQWVNNSSSGVKAMSAAGEQLKIPEFVYQLPQSVWGQTTNCVVEYSFDASNWAEAKEPSWQVDYTQSSVRARWRADSGETPPERAFFRIKALPVPPSP